MARDFTLPGLRDHLRMYLDHGYHCADFIPELISRRNTLVLRHDIDLDLACAVAVAETEATIGVRATFFVLMTSPLYNPYSVEAIVHIRRLRSLGHSIGLHYDPTVSEVDDIEAHAQIIAAQTNALSLISDGRVDCFSVHRPAAHGLTLPDHVGVLRNAYAPEFRREIEYSSDSGGWWRFGRYIDRQAFMDAQSVQLVLHPIWWVSEPDEVPYDRLERLVHDRRLDDQRRIAETVSPYSAMLGRETDGTGRWPVDPSIVRP